MTWNCNPPALIDEHAPERCTMLSTGVMSGSGIPEALCMEVGVRMERCAGHKVFCFELGADHRSDTAHCSKEDKFHVSWGPEVGCH